MRAHTQTHTHTHTHTRTHTHRQAERLQLELSTARTELSRRVTAAAGAADTMLSNAAGECVCMSAAAGAAGSIL
jgi:NADPH-dependent curcumin reductase CurA